MKYRTILLFGAPGAGKGTQGKILGTIPNFFHCACGDVFRSLNATDPLGRVFLEYSSRGELVPDEPTVELWRSFIQSCERTAIELVARRMRVAIATRGLIGSRHPRPERSGSGDRRSRRHGRITHRLASQRKRLHWSTR